METSVSSVEALYQRAEAYGKTTYELSKLKGLETTTLVSSALLSRLTVIIVFSVCALVLNIGIALWLGELLGKTYFGFFIVSAFYLVAGILLHFFMHQWIKEPFSNLIIKQVLQ